MFKIFKSIKIGVIVCSLTIILLATSLSCQFFSYKGASEGKIETSSNIYFNYPVRDYPIGKSDNTKLYWDCSENDFGNYLGEYNGLVYNGFHPGEDWNLPGEKDYGLPVYSIGTGKVIKISDLGSLGYLVIIEHDGNFSIPSKEINSNGQKATYKKEIVDKIYSVYFHVTNVKVKANDSVDENTVIGYIMNPGGGSHLHFEIRKNNDNHDSSWSLIGDSTNWQKFPSDGYNGYYKDLQKMVDTGLRDPSDFIKANKKGVVLGASNEIGEESVSIESETIAETASSEQSIIDTLRNLGKIAFSSNLKGKYEIYVINADGTNRVRLTYNNDTDDPNFMGDFQPAWSPDGSKIVFSSNRDGKNEICVMNADGSDRVRLTNNSKLESTLFGDFHPAWSPDGSKIAFTSDRDGGWEIYVINVDGSNQTKLTNDGDYTWVWHPDWSPDGSKIVFTIGGDMSQGIYVMNADGSGKNLILNNNSGDSEPAWSPDGNKIAFSSDRDGKYEIYVMNADGSGVTRLTNSDKYVDFEPTMNIQKYGNWEPDWSSDGSKIVFISNLDPYLDNVIYVMNADGSGKVLLAGGRNDWGMGNPAWH